ncbi:MAG TPA: PAS domain S-box protein [Candidatus Acidoferrales bacterium]|nr:PAS domain S-box protein [Candidatus Acidoferrales bacterium]
MSESLKSTKKPGNKTNPKDLFSEFARNAPVCLVVVRARENGEKFLYSITDINKMAEGLVGMEFPLSHPIELSSILTEGDAEKFLSAVGEAMRTSTTLDYGEIFLQRTTAPGGWYRVRMVPLHPGFVGIVFISTTYPRKIETALRESEERWQLVVWASGDGIWDWNLSNDTMFYSDRWFSITGYERNDVANHLKSFETFIHPDDSMKVKNILNGYLNKAISTYSVEYRFRMKSGTYKWVRESAQAVFDGPGKPIRIAGSLSDIDNRKQMEETLRRERILLRTLIDNIPDAIYVKDSECRKIVANLADIHNMHLESEEQVRGKNDFELFPKELAEGFYADDMAVIQKGKSVLDREEYVIDDGGDKKWLCTTKLPLRDEKGQIIGLVGIGRDITNSKITEQRLRESEKRFRLISENVVDIITVLDSDYVCLYASPSYRQDGIEPDAFVGKDFLTYVHPEDTATVASTFREAVDSYHYQEISFRFHRENGDWRIKEATVNALLSDRGVEILIVMRDITDRVAKDNERISLQEELKKRNSELESIIEEMKQMQRGLIQSEKLASIGQLVTGIAHEINNPLAFVNSNLNRFDEYFHEFVAMERKWRTFGETAEGNPAYRDTVHAIRRDEAESDIESLVEDFEALMRHTRDGADRIRKIVEQLRGFTHLSDSTMAEADLNAALDDTLSIVWNELKYKATVEKKYGNVPLVACNIGEMKQVFVNLLVNAAQAIKEKGEITIRTGVNGSNAVVEIEDTGSGISPELITKIFDPFFTTKPVGKGTGLGLWVSATIMEKHGGEINVESEVGKGTKMIVTLPIEGKL